MDINIKLGDQVKDIVTGFKGTVVIISQHLNGCVQCAVAPKIGKDGKYPDVVEIDHKSLEVIKKKVRVKKSDTGGSPRLAKKMKGF